MIGRCFRVFAAVTALAVFLVVFTGHAVQPNRGTVSAAFAANGALPQVTAGTATPEATLGTSPAGKRGTAVLTQSGGRSAARGGAASSGGSPILLYGQDWNGAPSTRSTAAWEQAAKDHAILVGTPGRVYGNMISQLHGWNPALKVLVYDLGPYTIAGSSEYTELLAGHPDYFARSASGALITVKAASGSPAYPKNTLMDEANPGWQAWEAQRIVTNIAKYGFDGAYVDSMGPGPFSGTTTAVPVDPSTRQAFTKTSWMVAAGHTLSVIKAAMGGKFLFSTGLVNGAEFTAFTHYLSDSTVNGVQTDSWLRVASSSPSLYPSAATLAGDLAMVQTLNAQGKSFFGWTKIWTTVSPAQEAAWNTYALAAYLLVDNGVSDYYDFSAPSTNADRTTIYFPDQLAALGAPLGAFTLSNGVYHRSFQHGTVTLTTTTNTASITTS